MRYFLINLCFLICMFFGCQREADVAKKTDKDSLFTLLPISETGIDFNNQLTESLNTNVLMYEYFYNGGGVAVGDLNGDNLEDVYFTANMTDNKLYLNKGDLEFSDVTDKAGVKGRPGPWKTGTTLVDINGDNKLDIFVCYSGKTSNKNRMPQLFINQGNNHEGIPIFKDESKAYGLTDATYCTQAYFFDYDRDGDLDMLQLNHNPTRIGNVQDTHLKKLTAQKDIQKGTRLLQNTGDSFIDVSRQAGIVNSILSYNLGAAISDVNNDGWPDMYIANDYMVPDYLYINNQDGTFTDNLGESIQHTSKFSMGNDAADLNNDGLIDIISLDMLPEDNKRQKLLFAPDNYEVFEMLTRAGFHRQYMRNMLQLNNGNGTFSEIGQLAGISNTDWSWSALAADYDNDGWKDIFVTNGYLRDYTNMDFLKYMTGDLQKKGESVYRKDLLDLVQKIPSSNVVNYAFKNKKGFLFENMQNQWGITDPSNSNGAAYSDLDNDGDLDLIINNVNSNAYVYQNNSTERGDSNFIKVKLKGAAKNTQGVGAKVFMYCNNEVQIIEQMPTRGFQSSVSPILHFGMGNSKIADSIKVNWLNGSSQTFENVKAGKSLHADEHNALKAVKVSTTSEVVFSSTTSPVDYKPSAYRVNDYKRQPLLVNPLSFQGPCMKRVDIDQDGLDDVFIGGGPEQSAQIFLQESNGDFILDHQQAFEADKNSTDTDAVFFDANGDSKIDVYIVSGGYHRYLTNDSLLQDRLYLNDGKGNFIRSKKGIPQSFVSGSCVKNSDLNGDGFQDLFVGGRVTPGQYPEIPNSSILINDGQGNFVDKTVDIAPDIQKSGMITDAVWLDMNGDKLQDLIVVGEWMPITVYINKDGKLQNNTSNYFDKEYSGWWNTIRTGDYNNDGIIDIVVGNMGHNNQFKASIEQPVELFYKDFDSNGAVDPIFSFYIQNVSYPYVSRDELMGQLPMMGARFLNYKSYADAVLDEIFTENERSNMKTLKANCLETSLFLGDQQHQFVRKDLPVHVQFAPVFSITNVDFDEDGDMDLLLTGNITNARLRLGSSDANYGVLLENNGDGNFNYIEQQRSGLKIKGDVRSSIVLSDLILFGINQQPLVAYKFKKL